MHRDAPLTLCALTEPRDLRLLIPALGRFRRLCQMIEEGWTIASSAESMRVSHQTAHKWWRRYQEAGMAGFEDRSSRPRRCLTKTPPKIERQVVARRRRHQLGPARLASRARDPGLYRILLRHGVNRLSRSPGLLGGPSPGALLLSPG
jgi:transposase-like protein